ncbi:MAG: exodeoxyribonuclease V subunit beta [Fibrobacteres bacterium]|nr:exodeoxyribonuclease V subunit beta [Fibrobacterota bacterium]
MKPLDLYALPLSGTNLIEASAGTGKTWTLTRLFLRLIVENEFPVDSILVMTFTNAAAHELRHRIRGALNLAIEGIDPDLNAYIDRHGRDKSLLRLKLALHRFDTAPIHTIHAFASSVLASYALESGQPAGLKLAQGKEEKELLDIAAADWWRINIATLPTAWLKFLGAPQPDIFRTTSKEASPFTILYPDISGENPDWEQIGIDAENLFTSFKKSWNDERTEFYEYLCDVKIFKGNKVRASYADGWFAETDNFCSIDSIFSIDALPASFTKICRSNLEISIKNGSALREFRTIEKIDKLTESFANLRSRMVHLKTKATEDIRRIFNEMKRKQGLTTFDDLLTNVYSGLSGKLLKNALTKKYKAALIDEFQDTDPIQLKIINTLFGTVERPLILIGDPKQAIYQFRGADLHTYIQATQSLPEESKLTISTNYRSDIRMVEGVNALFSDTRITNPFIIEGLKYHKIEADTRSEENRKFTVNGKDSSGITLLELVSNDGKQIGISDARKRISSATAFAIASILSDSATGRISVCGRAVKPSDIAVLTRKNDEAEQIREELALLNIPAITDAEKDLFMSDEAFELRLFMAAVIDFRSRNSVIPFMLSHWGGFKPNDILAFEDDSTEFTRQTSLLKEIKEIWETDGFAGAFEHFCRGSGLRERLIKYETGERAVTNISHLSEVLSEVEARDSLKPHTLLSFLDNSMNTETLGREIYQQRLERDDNAVTVQTIHRSKGLEYPIVFSPFLWSAGKGPRAPFVFHDDKGNRVLGIDNDDTALGAATLESRAEGVRLLYVALTRAKCVSFVVFGNIRDIDKSPIGHILPQDSQNAPLLSSLTIRPLPEKTREPLPASYEEICEYKPEILSRAINRDFTVSSFSSLTRSHHEEGFITNPALKAAANDEQTIFTFPKGKEAGSCIHKFFETIDFSLHDTKALIEPAEAALLKYRLDIKWSTTLTKLADEVLSSNLTSQKDTFTLSQIAPNERLAELQFHLPISNLTMDKLSAVLPFTDKLTFDKVCGYLNGFIDLIFTHNGYYYILDWKSNHLGMSSEDYSSKALEEAMVNNAYKLQYHLYIAALNRYLKTRVSGYTYDNNFGGVFYLFVRGMRADRQNNHSIYFDRPHNVKIEKLDALFGGANAR